MTTVSEPQLKRVSYAEAGGILASPDRRASSSLDAPTRRFERSRSLTGKPAPRRSHPVSAARRTPTQPARSALGTGD